MDFLFTWEVLTSLNKHVLQPDSDTVLSYLPSRHMQREMQLTGLHFPNSPLPLLSWPEQPSLHPWGVASDSTCAYVFQQFQLM